LADDRTVIADAGHKSRKLAGQLRRDGWQLRVFKRRQRVFGRRMAPFSNCGRLRKLSGGAN
jgi:hypothetical protein